MTKRCVLLVVIAVFSASCNRGASAPQDAAEVPTLDVTSWTDTTELFMEHPPLVAGETVRFAVHLTTMADFGALNAGRPSIEMTPEGGGATVTLPGSEPLRPGAFRVEGALPAAGRYRWALVVKAPGVSDRHEWFAIRYRGKFQVEEAETFTFRLLSDDGSWLDIDGYRVIDNDRQHEPRSKEGTVTLDAGEHEFSVFYYQGYPELIALQLFVKKVNGAERLFGPAI